MSNAIDNTTVVSTPFNINYIKDQLFNLFRALGRRPTAVEIRDFIRDTISNAVTNHPVLVFSIIGAIIGALIGWQLTVRLGPLGTTPSVISAALGGVIGGTAGGVYSREIITYLGRLIGNDAILRIANTPAHQNLTQAYIEQRLRSETRVLDIDLDDTIATIVNRFETHPNRPLEGVLSEILIQPLIRLLNLARADAHMLAHSIIGGLQDHLFQNLNEFLDEKVETAMIQGVQLGEGRKRQIIEEASLIIIYISRIGQGETLMNVIRQGSAIVEVQNNPEVNHI